MKTLLTALLCAAMTICAFGQEKKKEPSSGELHFRDKTAATSYYVIPQDQGYEVGTTESRFGTGAYPIKNVYLSAEATENVDIDVAKISPKFTITLRRGDDVVKLSAKDIEALLPVRFKEMTEKECAIWGRMVMLQAAVMQSNRVGKKGNKP